VFYHEALLLDNVLTVSMCAVRTTRSPPLKGCYTYTKFCFVHRASLYNLCKQSQLGCTLFLSMFISFVYMFRAGTAVAQWLRCCATNRKVAGSIPAGVIGILHYIKSFRSHYGPGVDSASNISECQEYFLGVKAAGA